MAKRFIYYLILIMVCVCMGLVKEKIEMGEQVAESPVQTVKKEPENSEEEVVETSADLTIMPGRYPIMGETATTIEQMISYFEESGNKYPKKILGQGGAPDIESFCRIYQEEISSIKDRQ